MMRFRQKRVARDFIQALNDRDGDRAIGMLDPAITYIDSRGVTLIGRDDVAELIRRLLDVPSRYIQTIEDISMRKGELLISASVTADDAEFTGKVLIRMVQDAGKIAVYQSYRSSPPVSMAMLLVPELARRGPDGDETAIPV
ncbi:nuclear transport factor 2 family protein [Pseudopontixanthobacter vadosimaris]|uniref:nuclear transport factor 2 family protein n=1 Tax=Pseudopontixanthobacter vadosimaris TaxID=2726450 RepID=UPI001474EB40|nr:nuclear transport factor 2 family protein [Pseudopontixanthobacter vadosimaris]